MKLMNTLTGKVEEFRPLEPGKVSIYVCGVTPYAPAHVGHAMSLMVYDVLVRYLRWSGHPHGAYEVTFATNYTDVDDKVIERAAELDRTPLDLSNENIAQWEEEQQLLGLTLPDHRPRVTEEIPPIIEMIEQILANDLAYVTPAGSVYFRVRDKQDYGKLSHRNIDQLRQGTRFEPGEEKEFALDFALWKGVTSDDEAHGEPAWDSPFGGATGGRGRPGWHIECSAMARTYLGKQFDIHGGGIDLVFPHHENEIAQAEAAGKDAGRSEGVFAKIWMHNGMVTRDSTKMSKSLGNVVSVQEALERWGPDAVRHFVLSSHYRASNNLTDEAMAAAIAGVDRLARAAHRHNPHDASGEAAAAPEASENAFVQAMEDDLNTPRALAVLHELASEVNRAIDASFDASQMQHRLRELGRVLGLTLADPASAEAAEAATAGLDAAAVARLAADLDVACSGKDAASTLDALVQARTDARAAKDFARGDAIRDALTGLGVILEDGPDGTRWTVKR